MSDEGVNNELSTEETAGQSPESTETQGTEATPVLAAEATHETEVDWRESIAEDLRGDSSLQDFKDVGSLAKSYVEARKMLGDSLRVPGEDASEEARAKFYDKLSKVDGVMRVPDTEDVEGMSALYSKLGRPDAPENYDLNLPDGHPIEAETYEQFVNLAYENGLSTKQVQAMAAFEAQRTEVYNDYINAGRESAERSLKEKWGADYDNRISGAKAAISQYEQTHGSEMKELISGPAGNSPLMMEILSDIYGQMQEKGTAGTIGSSVKYGPTAIEARAALQEIHDNKQHAFYNAADTGHQDALNRVKELNDIIYPE